MVLPADVKNPLQKCEKTANGARADFTLSILKVESVDRAKISVNSVDA